jgi:hypothetical protein
MHLHSKETLYFEKKLYLKPPILTFAPFNRKKYRREVLLLHPVFGTSIDETSVTFTSESNIFMNNLIILIVWHIAFTSFSLSLRSFSDAILINKTGTYILGPRFQGEKSQGK